MNVTILYKPFNDRDKAVLWMKERYTEYPDDSIVSSFMTKDNGWTTSFVVINQAKLKPEKKKLIKII